MGYDDLRNIRLSEKCLSFTDTSFATTHLYTNLICQAFQRSNVLYVI